MDDQQHDRVAEQCRRLVLALAYHGDHGDAARAGDLFADDGTWIRGGVRYTGPAQIATSYAAGSATAVVRHLNGGTVVTVIDDDHAEAVTNYVAFTADPGTTGAAPPYPLRAPFSVGEWRDGFVRTATGWRFASRTTVRLFQRDEGTP
jgi:hypothetical protein